MEESIVLHKILILGLCVLLVGCTTTTERTIDTFKVFDGNKEWNCQTTLSVANQYSKCVSGDQESYLGEIINGN